MATHDYVIANGTGAAVRSDINGALAAIVTNNSDTVAPATTYAFQWWADTTTGLLKIRNAANSAFITVGTLGSANLALLPLGGGTMTGALNTSAGTAAAVALGINDTNTGFFSSGTDEIAVSTGGTQRVTFSTASVTSTLPVLGPDATAAAPAYTFSSDTDTGLFRVGANSLGLSTGGTVRVTIASTGDTTFAGDVLLSGTGQLDLPAGTTAQRSASPNSGMIRFNTTLTQFEGYNGTAWGAIGGGATGGGSDRVFYENGQTVTTNYTLTTSTNAMCAGPITINSGVTVTVGAGQNLVIV